MIHIADFLSDTPRQTLKQAQRYLAECNSSGVTYRVSDDLAQSECADISILYQLDKFYDHGLTSKVIIKVPSGTVMITTYLADAVRLLALLADKPSWLRLMRELDPSMTAGDVWAVFGLDEVEIFRSDLRPMTTGDFIAPYHDGFAEFSVDTHGEVSVEAEAPQLAVIVFHFAALQDYAAKRVDEKFARFSRFAYPD